MKRFLLWASFLLAFTVYLGTDAHCATKYYGNAASCSGAGTNSGADCRSIANLADDVFDGTGADAAAACGDNFYIAAGTTLTDTTDWLAINTTGCTTGSRITVRMDPAASDSATHPRITGDWVPTNYDVGDAGIRLYEDVDWVDIINIDLRGYRVGLFTGDNTLKNGMSTNDDADGKNNNITIKSTAKTNPIVWDQMQMGMVIYGVNNATCGPLTSCDTNTELINGNSGAWTIENITIRDISHRGILGRNGTGDDNTDGTGNGFSLINVTCAGGGATYDKSGSQTGQGCVDLGQSSASTGTPDSNWYIENIKCSDLQNRNSGPEVVDEQTKYKNGDCIKTEPETDNIKINKVSCTSVIDSCVDTKSFLTEVSNVVCAKSTHCIKSYSPLVNKLANLNNILSHHMINVDGIQPVHSFQTFGHLLCTDCTSTNIDENGMSHLKLQVLSDSGGTAGSSQIFWNDSIMSQDNTHGTSITNAPSVQYSGDCNTGGESCTYTPNANSLNYDAEGAVTSGTNPQFGTMDEDYYDIEDTATCAAFEPSPSVAAYNNLGFRCLTPVTPHTVLDAPTSVNATATSDTEISLSWTNPTASSVQPFQTASVVRIESPTGGGFSTYATLDSEKIVSGSFEDTYTAGVETNWTSQDTDADCTFAENTANPYVGTSAQSMTCSDFDDKIYQEIAGTSNGTVYNTGCWYYTATPQYFKFAAQENGGSFNVLASTTLSEVSTWSWREFQWTATATAPRLKIYGASGIAAGSNILIDGCSTAPATLTSSTTVTGRTASTQYNLEVIAVNTIGNSTGSQDDATTTAPTGGSGEGQATGTGGQVVQGPGCAIGRT